MMTPSLRFVLPLVGFVALVLLLAGLLLDSQVGAFLDAHRAAGQVDLRLLTDFIDMLAWEVLGLFLGLSAGLLLVCARLARRVLGGSSGSGSAQTSSSSSEASLDLKAHTDSLTDLPNRMALLLLLEQSRQRAHAARDGAFAVCFFDVDGLGSVNEKYGRAFGDRLLQSVAQRVRAIARQGDYLARVGDDQFVLVVHGLANIWEMEPVLSRLMHVTATPITLGQTQMRFAFSVGVTLYPRDASDVDGLMTHAQAAMMQAKKAGGGRWLAWQAETAEI